MLSQGQIHYSISITLQCNSDARQHKTELSHHLRYTTAFLHTKDIRNMYEYSLLGDISALRKMLKCHFTVTYHPSLYCAT